MKNPLYKQILKGVFLCVFLLCLLSLILALLHDFNLRRAGIESFFRESVYESRRMEHEYSRELRKMQDCLPVTGEAAETSESHQFSESQKVATRTAKRLLSALSRGLRGFGLPDSDADLQYAATSELRNFSPSELFRLRNEMERALHSDPQTILLLQRLKRELAAVSELIAEDDLELRYFSAQLCAMIYNSFGSIDVGEIERSLLSVPEQSSVGSEIARNLIIMLILRSYGNELAVNFLAPLRSLLNFDPETFAAKFFDLRMAGFRFSFYYRGLNMVGDLQNFFFPETDELIDPFAGYLTVNVRTNRVFERQMELYSQKNPGYRFYTSRALENEFRDLQKAGRAVFLYDPVSAEERPSSFTELLAVFSDMREVLRFRWQHPERGWIYSVIMPDAIFDDYVHLHEVPLSLFVRYDTLFHALRVLLLLLFIFGLIFAFVFPFVSSPLRSFAGLITKTGLDFSPLHTASFRPVFRELSLMKDAFCRRLERVNRHISLREGLLQIQNLIRDEVDRQTFVAAVNEHYQKYFNVGFKAYDPEADLLVLDGLSDAGGLSDGFGLSGEDVLSDGAGGSDVDDAYLTVEREPFDEQVRFYYQKEILEQEFLDSLSQNREFELARQVQLSLLPRNVQNQDNYEISTFYLAARFLGGDFFEVIQSSEKSVFLIADVSGKGFGSSLFGAAVKSLFGAYYRKGLKLDEIFIALNTALIRHFHQQLFCTCFAAEKQGSKIQFCSAGHNNMYLVRKKEIITLWAEGLPFGLLEGYNYKSGSLELVDQDLLFLYTDGCNEAESAKKTLFGDDELQACVLRNSNVSPELFNREMYAALSEHSRGAEQSDDITYIIVRFHLDKQGT